MMTRRDMTLAGAAVLGLGASGQAQESAAREFYELCCYTVTDAQYEGLARFLSEVMAPAVARQKLGPLGLFGPREGAGKLWALFRHPSLDSLLTLNARLLADAEFRAAADPVIGATAEAPALVDWESRLLHAFEGFPRLQQPASGPDRVFQLRIYESPSGLTHAKKVEMFNTAELAIFRDCGLNAVIFGQAMVGPQMPNLTYLLGFENAAAQAAAWTKFRTHPDWIALRSKPEYADKRIIRKITNVELRPLPGSQI